MVNDNAPIDAEFTIVETNEEYHADTTRVSNSMLSVLKRSPQEFQGRYITKTMPHPESTEAMALGSLLHCMVLEPHKIGELFVTKSEGIDRRTTVGKIAWASFIERAVGKTIVTHEQYETSEACANALLRHDQLSSVLNRPGIVEQRINFEFDGLDMRCKPDFVLLDHNLIVDIKTTADASPDAFAKSIASFGYARQAALYRDAVALEHGLDCRFLFAVVCTKAPYEVACYELTDEAMRSGQQEASSLVYEFKQRCDTNNWLPVWSRGIVPIGLPRWYRHESFEIEKVES